MSRIIASAAIRGAHEYVQEAEDSLGIGVFHGFGKDDSPGIPQRNTGLFSVERRAVKQGQDSLGRASQRQHLAQSILSVHL